MDRGGRGALRIGGRLPGRGPLVGPHLDRAPRRRVHPEPVIEETPSRCTPPGPQRAAAHRRSLRRRTTPDTTNGGLPMSERTSHDGRRKALRSSEPATTWWRRRWTPPTLAELAEFGEEQAGRARARSCTGPGDAWIRLLRGSRGKGRDRPPRPRRREPHRHLRRRWVPGRAEPPDGPTALPDAPGSPSPGGSCGYARRRLPSAHERQARSRRPDLQRILRPVASVSARATAPGPSGSSGSRVLLRRHGAAGLRDPVPSPPRVGRPRGRASTPTSLLAGMGLRPPTRRRSSRRRRCCAIPRPGNSPSTSGSRSGPFPARCSTSS